MKNWQVKKLNDVAKFTNGGAWSPDEYAELGIPVVRVSDISEGTVNLAECKYLASDRYEKYKKHILFTGDLVITTVGSHPTQMGSVVGRPAIVPRYANGAFLNQNAVKITPSSQLLDKTFLGYLGKSKFFRDYIIGCARGSANQVRMSIELLKEMLIPIPPLPTQRKIASILSAYDDLIENNTRRIKILEEMAQMLYREWFVNFRFPNHENVKMVESELGLIPEGWEVKKLGDIASINSLSLKVTNAPDEINYIDISSVSTGQIDKVEIIDFVNAPSRARRIVKHGDIIWATVRPNRKSYSLILNPPDNLIVSTGFAVITARKTPYTYLYKALTTDSFVDYLTNNATGSAYPAVNSSDFKNADIVMPDKFLLDKYHNIVVEMLQQKQNLQNKNINLRKTRDLLLPKLISGEIDVENLDIETVAAAA